VETLAPEVVEDLRHGRATRERKMAVCTGGAHLAPAERVEILAVLTGDPDEVVAGRAEEALVTQSVESFVTALESESAATALFAYAAKNLADKPGIADAMVANKNCAPEHLVPVIRHLTAAATHVLLEDLDRVSQSPALASALEHANALTPEQKELLHELLGSSIDEAALAEAASRTSKNARPCSSAWPK
jgi:hypothetical protein